MRFDNQYEVVALKDINVTMRDGIVLSTDLYCPAKDGIALPGPWPTVLIRTAYNKNGFQGRSEFFASHGYLAVAQDVRGTFASEGDFFPFVNEDKDGFDTVEWLSNHEKCNGKIGTYGCSYMGWVQLAMATQNPPGLTCMVPFGVAVDTFHQYVYFGGCLHLNPFRWIIYDVWRRDATVRNNREELEAIEKLDFTRFVSEMPWKRGKTVLAMNPKIENAVFAYIENRSYTDFWKRPGQGFQLYLKDFPDIPILWTSGWYDGFPYCECEGYRMLSELGRGKNQYLLIGPWIHNQMSGNQCGDADFSPNANIDRNETLLSWFDRWLKDDREAYNYSRCRLFIMGGGSTKKTADGLLHVGGKWWQGNDWPPSGTNFTPYYLHADNKLKTEEPSGNDSCTTYQYDPENPTPSLSCPWPFPSHSPRGPSNQVETTELLGKAIPGRPVINRTDVISFQTEPLKNPVIILGPVKVKLHVSSDAPDTDFSVKLVDLYPANHDYPEGYALSICEGLKRMSYRNGNNNALMKPDEIYEIEIECFPAGNMFAKGHCIRLDISSSNFPRCEINRNTGDPQSAENRIANNTVYHNSIHSSHLLLPLQLTDSL